MTDVRNERPAPAEERLTTEGPVYTVTGGGWDTLIDAGHDDRIVINMGPQHPSTHGVLRLVPELEGETVQQARSVIGCLHMELNRVGSHLVSDGGTRPLRVHVREPSFVNLQTMPAMSEGGMVADVIAAVASIDPVMGGVDR